MTLVPTDESKKKLKKDDEIWSKIKALTWSTNNNSDDYDEKHVKVKFSSDDVLSLKKTLELYEKKKCF